MKKLLRLLLAVFVLCVGVLAIAVGYFFYSPAAPMPELPGVYQTRLLQLDGYSRYYSVYSPSSLKPAAPVIFVLHGSTQSGNKMRRQTAYEFDLLAEQYGFLAVYPDGVDGHWNDCRASADYTANTANVDDPAFFANLIDQLVDTYAIDSGRVFVTGFSNGGHMAYRLALETPELVAAIAPIAANLPVAANLDCERSGAAVAVAIFNGTEDPINPYQGGLVSIMGNDSRGEVLSAQETALYWVGLAGIKTAAERFDYPQMDADANTAVFEQRWQQSPQAGVTTPPIQVRLYTLQGSGHVIPSPIARFPRIIGPEAADLSAAEAIVDFFLGTNSQIN